MIAFKLVTVVGILGMSTSCALSQIVNFNNSVLPEPPDRTVYMPDGVTPIRGTSTTQPASFVAQLYYGTNGAPADSLQPVTSAPARFRPAGTGDGLWLGGIRTLTGVAIGDIVTLQVRAWDAGGIGLTYDEVRMVGGLWGDSATFTHRIPPGDTLPSDDYMDNFSSFSLVPEGSTIALVAVGALGLALWIRRRP
jgi:hypothetical protein